MKWMTRFVAIAIVVIFVFTSAIRAQQPQATPPLPAFEVASIKPHVDLVRPAEMIVGGDCHGIDSKSENVPFFAPLGRCVFMRVSLRFLLSRAYSDQNPGILFNQMITGGPSWADTDIFDIEAKAEDPSTANMTQLREMLRNLLFSTRPA